jgi:hypothetical protein
MKDCKHTNIVLVTENPIGLNKKGNKIYMGIPITFVECEDCKIILPIHRVTQEKRDVPLCDFNN